MNSNPTSAALKLTTALLAIGGLLAGCESPDRELPPEKQAVLQQAAQQLRLAQLNEGRTPSTGQPPAALATAPEPAWQTGIIEGHAAPFRGSVLRLENQWQRTIGSNHVNVYAGASGQDPQQGLVIVQRTPLTDEGHLGAPTFIQAPTRSGTLRIVSESGTVLTLRAADGSTYAFDAASATLTAR